VAVGRLYKRLCIVGRTDFSLLPGAAEKLGKNSKKVVDDVPRVRIMRASPAAMQARSFTIWNQAACVGAFVFIVIEVSRKHTCCYPGVTDGMIAGGCNFSELWQSSKA